MSSISAFIRTLQCTDQRRWHTSNNLKCDLRYWKPDLILWYQLIKTCKLVALNTHILIEHVAHVAHKKQQTFTPNHDTSIDQAWIGIMLEHVLALSFSSSERKWLETFYTTTFVAAVYKRPKDVEDIYIYHCQHGMWFLYILDSSLSPHYLYLTYFLKYWVKAEQRNKTKELLS